MMLTEGMFDYDLRVKKMSEADIDITVVSLTCPNVFWGDAKVSLRTAQLSNDEMATA